MALQHPGWSPGGRIPDSHQTIRAATDYLAAIGTPVDVVERDHVALHDMHTLSALYVPHAQGRIIAPAEEPAAVRREGNIEYSGSMPVQHCAIASLLHVPQPDRFIKAGAGNYAPIWAPLRGMHRSGVPRKGLSLASAIDIP